MCADPHVMIDLTSEMINFDNRRSTNHRDNLILTLCRHSDGSSLELKAAYRSFGYKK